VVWPSIYYAVLCRSGVAVNVTIREWENRKSHNNQSIVTVMEHKSGDKEPASIVLNEDMSDLMER